MRERERVKEISSSFCFPKTKRPERKRIIQFFPEEEEEEEDEDEERYPPDDDETRAT